MPKKEKTTKVKKKHGKSALMKDNFKEIRNTFKRFLSILLMAFLGVGFFAGIQATSPDMVDTIDKYYKQQNVYDIQILSTLGLTENDVNEVSKIEGIEKVVGTYETDAKLEIGEKETVAKVLCIEDVNIPKLLEGNFPQGNDECVVEQSFLDINNKKIGDTIELEIEKNKNDNGDEIDYLKNNKLKIVGVVQSPLYISRDRGNSKLGAGKVNYYLYVNKSNINLEIYTNMYLKVKDASKYTTSKNDYKEIVENVEDKLSEIKESREQARKDELVATATDKLKDAEKEFNKQKEEANNKIADAEKKIENGRQEIVNGENEIAKNEKKANAEFSKAESQINTAKNQITKGEKELKQQEITANVKIQELEKQKVQMQENIKKVAEGINIANQNYKNIVELLQMPNLPEEQKIILEAQKKTLEHKLQELQNNKKQLEDAIIQVDNGIATGKVQLEQGKKQLQIAKNELQVNEKNYQKTKASTQKQLKDAKNKLQTAKEELKKGEDELIKQKEEVNKKLEEAEGKLIEARDEIAKIEKPTWYILDREANSGYVSFIQDTKSIANIGKVFPVVFFIVAMLISLTSMTRMVEEQRTEIGTLKALGYNKFQIASKYIIYASFACIIGGILGMCVGFVTLPLIIWKMYTMMYQMTPIVLNFDWFFGGTGLVLIYACILGATGYSIRKELKETPASLMRPRAPKMGKRVLLERINFIWKRLKFSQKVTVRNIFRYKKRVLMTIIGIMGCTSLILAGFGLKDSISSIMPRQYGKVFNYDIQVNLKSGLEDEQLEKYINQLQQKEEISKIAEVYMMSTKLSGEKVEEDAQIIVPKNNETLKDIISIIDLESQNKIELNSEEIVITDKAAQLLDVKIGDNINLKDNDGNIIQAKIGNIAENYINHYVYMSKELYQKLYNEKYSTNVLLVNDNNLSTEQEEQISKEMLNANEVTSVSAMATFTDMINDTLKSLNYVVVVLIVTAGMLAFVVLYNLSNVNISERIRELSTLKVLGFYDKEVYNYVAKETTILTAIGILLGLVGGFFLNYFIIETCEINMLRFAKVINPISYVYSILITIVFTLIVNIVTYFTLKKIDMIESLKSVE